VTVQGIPEIKPTEATIHGLLMAVENVGLFLAGQEIPPDRIVVRERR